jgi:gamma-glutamyltranspeptidase/glutathione hydrolase/leukotriene-C4 hydrolase
MAISMSVYLHLSSAWDHSTHATSGSDNYPEPGKRPLSSTVPTIVEHPDGSFFVAIGGSGGSKIFPSVFQVLLNLDWGLDIREAIEFGRLHDQLYPLVTDADDIYPEEILDDLRQRGHNVSGTVLLSVTSIVCIHIFFPQS